MQVVQLTPLQHCIVYDRFRVVVILPCASLFVRTPTLLKLLKDSLSKKSRKRKFSKQKHLGLVTVICKILNIYKQNLNGLSKINGLRMSRAGMTKRSIREFNQTYDTVSYQTINRVLDSFAKKSVARVRTWKGLNVSHCGDNVDKRIKKRHEMEGKSNLDLHMYNNALYKPRIMVDNLSDEPPTVPDVNDIDLSQFIVNTDEGARLKELAEIMIAQTWSKIERLKDLAAPFSSDTPHEFSAEMKLKSEKVF